LQILPTKIFKKLIDIWPTKISNDQKVIYEIIISFISHFLHQVPQIDATLSAAYLWLIIFFYITQNLLFYLPSLCFLLGNFNNRGKLNKQTMRFLFQIFTYFYQIPKCIYEHLNRFIKLFTVKSLLSI
jgi:hypothetical protein